MICLPKAFRCFRLLTLSLAYIPFGVKFMAHCIHSVYGYCGVDRKGNFFFFFFFFVRCVYGGIDKEVKLFTFCTLCLFRKICIPQHAQLSEDPAG